VLRARDGSERVEEEADAVVLVTTPAADRRLMHELESRYEVAVVGDAGSPRDLPAAVADAYRVATQI
jgi:hypothetical protein